MLLTGMSGFDGIIQFITVLLIFALVLAVTFVVTRWLGKYQKMQTGRGNIQIVETVRISPSAYVEILKIGKRYIAVAVAKESASFLCELKEEELENLAGMSESKSEFVDFESIFSKLKSGFPKSNPYNNEKSGRNDD